MTEAQDHHKHYHGIRVAVLGASGFIGRWVARALCRRGAELYLVVRHKGTAKEIFSKFGVQGRILELDLSDEKVIEELLRETKSAITFNLAGYGVDSTERDEKIAYQINANLVRALSEAVASNRDPNWTGQDLVHVGSALEYGAIGGNLSEDSMPNPTTLYGKSKLAGTQYLIDCCEKQGVKGLIARLFMVYGPGEHQGRLLPSLLDAAKTKKTIQLTSGIQKRDFTYVEDVAEGLLRLGLASTLPGAIVNLATGKLISVREFVEVAARILQIPDNHLKFGSLPIQKEEMDHLPITLARLRKLTGWTPPINIEEGVLKTISYEMGGTCN